MILLIFITLIPLSILKIVEIRRGVELSIEAELKANQDYAEAINLAFMNFLERTWSNQYMLGKALIAHPEKGMEYIEDYLKKIASDEESFKMNNYWSTPEGIVSASSTKDNILLDISGRNFFKEIIGGKEKVIGDLEYSVVNGELIIPIARAIKVDGELKGIVINTIEAKNMKHIIPISRMGAGSLLGLADRNANIVYRNGNNAVLNSNLEAASEDSPIRRALKGEIVKTYSRNSQVDGIERIGVDYPIREIGWCSFVATPLAEVLESGRQSSIRNLVVFILIYIISFIIAFLISSGFMESIEKLILSAHKVKNGDLSVRTQISNDNDLGDVGQAFDSMVEALSEKAREEKEYNDLKTQFLATISHEFKTPLNIILGSIQILENPNIEGEEFHKLLNKYIKMQKQNSYRLLRLINNFIDITKIENNYIKVKSENNDIVRVVEDITMSVVEYTRLKDIKIIFDTDVEEKIIAFDADMMERIILNLLSNSIKFTKPGGTIEVNICTEEDIKISIKDSGIGIPEDKLETIFDRYAQVENSMRKSFEGSGIGLSLVKSLVELHEGSISVQSRLGEGSEFVIVLPDRILDRDYVGNSREDTFNTERIHVEFSDIYI